MTRTVRKLALALTAGAAIASVSVVGAPGTAEAGVGCTPKYHGVKVYQTPKPHAPAVRSLKYGKEYGCGTTSNHQFFNVSHNGHHVGYVYRDDMRR